jgi:hypothetical protein
VKIVVFTPTRQYGGLDVTYSALKRQEGVDLSDLLWVVGDELYKERAGILKTHAADLLTLHFDTTVYRDEEPGLVRTYVHAYQDALRLARDLSADMFVSLQDYIIPPVDGLARFIAMNENPEYGGALFTGLMSHAGDPTADEVHDLEGKWTIFAEPYESTPTTISWADVRHKGPGIHQADACWWECNWGAVGRTALHDARINYDLSYDMGIAYENSDFAMQAQQLGYRVYMDCDNHALGLPHRAYWPHQEKEDVEINLANKARYQGKWG